MNEVLPVNKSQMRPPSQQDQTPINPTTIDVSKDPNSMVNPPQPLIRQDSSVLRKTPEAILNEIYECEGGVRSLEQDEHFCLGCRRCCGSMCEGCTNEEIREGSVGVITEFGKYVKIVGSGAQSYNCCTQMVVHVPVVQQVLHLPNQRVITKDGLQLLIKAFVKYQIIHPQLFLFNHSSPNKLLELALQGTLRSVIGQKTLRDNLSNQSEIKQKVARLIKHRVEEYGLIVYDAEIERMQMDINLERALAVVAESGRQAKAKVVKAKANLESSKMYRKAADELSKNPMAIQLKYLDVLKDVAAKQSTLLLRDTIVEEMKKKNLQNR